jgi:hypothetical protein
LGRNRRSLLPISRLTRTEIQSAIHSLNPKKSPGYDLLTSKTLQELPIGIKYLTQLFNAVLYLTYFPAQWKVAKIILILKPGKPPNALPCYETDLIFVQRVMNEVIDFFFNLHNISSRTMALRFTESLTEMSARRSYWG